MINAPPSIHSSKIRNFITLPEYAMTMKIIVGFVRPDVKKNFNQCISKLQFMRFFLQHNTRTKKMQLTVFAK